MEVFKLRVEYKVEMVRFSKNRLYACKDVEKIINDYAKEGWLLQELNYDNHLFAYEIVFTRNIKD